MMNINGLLTHFFLLRLNTHQEWQQPEDFDFDDFYDQDDGEYAQHNFIFEEFFCVTNGNET